MNKKCNKNKTRISFYLLVTIFVIAHGPTHYDVVVDETLH